MADILVAKRVIDYVGLNVKSPPSSYLGIPHDLAPVLALLQGMGSDGAKLVNVDANGNLAVTMAGQAANGLQQIDLGTNSPNAWRQASGIADTTGGSLTGSVGLWIFNGASWDRMRSASAVNQAAASGLGAIEAAPPGNIPAFSAPALGAQASASRAAGAAGVRHVCTGYDIIVSCQAAPAAGQLLINLRDGATGAGAILKQWAFEIPAAVFAPFILSVGGRSIFGSAATAMTLESSAAYAAVGVSVAFDSFDAS